MTFSCGLDRAAQNEAFLFLTMRGQQEALGGPRSGSRRPRGTAASSRIHFGRDGQVDGGEECPVLSHWDGDTLPPSIPLLEGGSKREAINMGAGQLVTHHVCLADITIPVVEADLGVGSRGAQPWWGASLSRRDLPSPQRYSSASAFPHLSSRLRVDLLVEDSY